MVFSSTIFLLYFLPIFMVLYHLVPKVAKNYVVLFASILFYAWGGPKFIFVILGSSALNFYLVKHLHQTESVSKKKWLLFWSVIINVGLLAYFKYANFFIDNFNLVLAQAGVTTIEWTKVVLPIGISFFTFQVLTYSIDVYRKVEEPLEKLSDYLLYILSFPQMIAGPIVRFASVADEIRDREEKIDDKLNGFYRFCIGLSKKVIISNVLGEQADLIMNSDITGLSSGTAWLGLLAYTMQIYFDFSGYSDMAIGLGKIMGFHFPENFNNPYVSRNISEFWRRWHMTLGTWMRDYLYIPLGGNRVDSTFRLYFNLWIVFLLSGFWHGASWNFIIWGAYHGVFLILDRIFLIKLTEKMGAVPSVLLNIVVVMIGWLFFRMETTEEVFVYLGRMFDFSTFSQVEVTVSSFVPKLILALVFSLSTLVPLGARLEQKLFYSESFSFKTNVLFAIASMILFFTCMSSISSQGFNPFIYFRF